MAEDDSPFSLKIHRVTLSVGGRGIKTHIPDYVMHGKKSELYYGDLMRNTRSLTFTNTLAISSGYYDLMIPTAVCPSLKNRELL